VPPLHELQRRFAAALFDETADAASIDIRADAGDGAARLGIYLQQLRAHFQRALALEFPVIKRLVGADYFGRLARDFQARHPSRAGDLAHIGAPFAAFLEERFGAGRYAYLAPVAALEWAYHESMHAPEAPGLDCNALAQIDSTRYPRLRFELHPACRLYSCAYPVLDIWRANQPDAQGAQSIDLASGATRVLLHRRAQVVEFHALSAAHYALVAALARRATLGAAFDAARKADAAFDLGAALRHLVALGALTAARLGGARDFEPEPC
jgi:hypothetical protein